jgi:hypothetical protein
MIFSLGWRGAEFVGEFEREVSGIGVSGCPHSGQNFEPGDTGLLQCAQDRPNGAAHCSQNFA